MTAKDLLGKYITEIHTQISESSNSGFIPLEFIEVEMKLFTGELVFFPDHPEVNNIELDQIKDGLRKVFPARGTFGFTKKKSMFDKLDHKKIIGIWQIDDDFAEEICALEFINGYFLVKGPMAPIGTGNADLFLFESKSIMQRRFPNKIKKIHSLVG